MVPGKIINDISSIISSYRMIRALLKHSGLLPGAMNRGEVSVTGHLSPDAYTAHFVAAINLTEIVPNSPV